MNRGSRPGWRHNLQAEHRFNEAPIHESGKSCTPSELRLRQPASMRPRFMNRGSFRALRSPRTPTTRFNEAPIHESGKYADDSARA